MNEQLFDPDDFEEPFVNEDCPEQCSEDHGSPDDDGPDSCGQWECPSTGTVYVIDQGTWEPAQTRWGWARESTYVECADEWYIEPYDHGFSTCDDCGGWGYSEDMMSDRYGDYTYCEYCYDRNGHGGQCGGSTTPHCKECSARTVTHWHPVTEDVYCESHGDSHGVERIPELVAA